MSSIDPKLSYVDMNAMLNLLDSEGNIRFEADKMAVRKYFLEDINLNTVFFHSLEEKLNYLVTERYYDKAVVDLYPHEFRKALFSQAYKEKFRFKTFIGALKFYVGYALKTRDGSRFLERYEDRIAMCAMTLAQGDQKFASQLVSEMISGRFQPATPTYLNTGKQQRGEFVSCFLLRMEDNMESISRSVTNALQLSKRGGGVALLMTNIRGRGAPIKGVEGIAAGVVPVMKILEDSFTYADQLGARQGAGAVYLNVHHPDIMEFLDTKRENADEKIRIKTLSIGLVIPDITFLLAKRNEDMYLFEPYDIERYYGTPMSDLSITEMYDTFARDRRISKKKISARKLLEKVAELQFESGYPYILFEDNANRAHTNSGRINMSNLCSEILQKNSPSIYNEDQSYKVIGNDISCNLGSQNVLNVMRSGNIGDAVNIAIRALTAVSDMSSLDCVPSVRQGNAQSHAVGLGQMNLHGFFMSEGIAYDSPEAVDFTSAYFAAVAYHAVNASCELARERNQVFAGYEDSKYADGSYFNKYLKKSFLPKTEKVKEVFAKHGVQLPTMEDWAGLKERVKQFGIYNAYLMAVAPTGSISYVNNATSSIHPIASRVEARKEGKLGRCFYPSPELTNENKHLYKDAYEVGPYAIIDVYAAATEHVDQGLSLTVYLLDTATTRDVNKIQVYAWSKGIKTIYYMRVRQKALEGTESKECASCQV